MKKIALITGITGQDGSYLAELLLSKNYEVHGIKRRTSFFNTTRIDQIYESLQNKKKKFFLHFGDLNDASFINKIVSSIKPDEIYNLAAQSHVAVSFQIPEYTSDVNAMGTIRILEAIKNNILGTKIVADAASKYNCQRFMLISTDKAVNPTNVLGDRKSVV